MPFAWACKRGSVAPPAARERDGVGCLGFSFVVMSDTGRWVKAVVWGCLDEQGAVAGLVSSACCTAVVPL